MPFLIEHITDVVFTLLVLIVLGNLAIIGLTITRRQRREKYFRRIDALRSEYAPVIEGILNETTDYAEGINKLKTIGGIDRLYMLERLCMERKVSPGKVATLRKICEDLGLVAAWQRRLRGTVDVASLREAITRPEGMIERIGKLRFLVRAKSAENLGLVRHRESWSLLVAALDDPHPDMQSVASRALAAIGEPASFGPLVKRLQDVVENPKSVLSLRSVKTALVSFPLASIPELLPSLTHSNRRVRFLATDIVREMAEREAESDDAFLLDRKILGAELTEIFLGQLPFDENPDVRARAAVVISYLADPRSTPVLLTLLQDTAWFVRLHAVRALNKRKFLPHVSRIAQTLSDPQWRVREAAVHTLRSFGSVGIKELTAHFLSTNDQYSREQIADEIQRAGLLAEIISQYATDNDEGSRKVLRQLAAMGKTSYMVNLMMMSDSDVLTRKKMLTALEGSNDSQIQWWIQRMAREENDAQLRAMAQAVVNRNSAVREN